MEKTLHFHILHYLVLAVILSLAVVLFFIFVSDSHMQFRIAFFTCVAYFSWGIIHHKLEGDLHPKIVVEYLLVALLALFLLRGAIIR